MDVGALLSKFLLWRARHISKENFLFILSIIVGIASGLAAVTLKSATHFIQMLLTNEFEFTPLNYLYLAYPMVGMLLVGLFVKYFNKNKLGHGVPNVLYSISKRGGFIERDKTYSHMITSAITVGFGGSVGLEAPIVTTGSAIGSNLARIFSLSHKQRTLLVGCGAAAAISGIFNSPITGVVFALEILMLELSVPALIPLLLAAITGTVVSKLLLGDHLMFEFNLLQGFMLKHLHLYVALGLLAGLFSVYYTRSTNAIEAWFSKYDDRVKRAMIAGPLLGVLIFILPPLYGEGFNTLKLIFSGHSELLMANSMLHQFRDHTWVLMLFVLATLLVKVVASSLTTGGGGNGGVFAPSLFTGGLLGFMFARLVKFLNISSDVSDVNFGLVGMAGIISGVMHAPLTGMFLVLEITQSYELIIPLMVVSVIAYATIHYFEPHSIYTSQLARKGHLLFGNKDRQVLTLMKLEKAIEKDLKIVHPDQLLGDLVKQVAKSKRNIFPVLDDENVLKGIITLDDVREIMFKQEKYSTVYVKELMHAPPAFIDLNEDMEQVMKKFDKTGAWNLPVTSDGKYVGLLSKSKIFNIYRKLLIDQAKD